MFPKYPYLDLSDRNLDFLTKAIREMENEVKNFVSLNAVKYANPIQWSINRQYEKNTIVIDPLTGTAFISVQPVPSGVALTRTQYWTPVFDLSQFVTKAASNFANSYERDVTTTATMPTGAGDWVVWDSTLYVALTSIHAGDAYVVNGNIKRMTVEDFYDLLMEAISALDSRIDNEVENRQNADSALGDRIDDEIRDRQDADGVLQDADSVLQDNIDAEALARENADGVLQDNIDAEALARQNADITLQSSISQTIERISDVKASIGEIVINVKDYGAYGNGVHDDITAIESAIAALKTTGGTIYFPAGEYAISRPIHIGDGTARTTLGTAVSSNSTYNSIKFVGAGCENVSGVGFSAITPLNVMESLIFVDGKICNVNISGMILWCNAKAMFGLYICATSHSTFSDLYIYNPTNVGLYICGGSLPTGNYNTFNTFERIICVLNTDATVGLLMDGVMVRGNTPVNNDTWITNFVDCRFQAQPGVSSAIMGFFKFCDNCTFTRCHFVGGDNTCTGVNFNADSNAPNNNFPMGLAFYDCSIVSYSITEFGGDSKYIGKQYVIGAGVNDAEVLPRTNKIFGFDANGRMVGGFTYNYVSNYDDLAYIISTVPNNYAANITISPTYANALVGVSDHFCGVAHRINDTTLYLYMLGCYGAYYVQFNLSDASVISSGKCP